jgi:hypothetical protein
MRNTGTDKWFHVSWRDRRGIHETQIAAGSEKEAEKIVKERNGFWFPSSVRATFLFENK